MLARRSASAQGSKGGGPSFHRRQHAAPARQPARTPVLTAARAAPAALRGLGGKGSRGGGGGHGLVSAAREMSTASDMNRDVGHARPTPMYPLNDRPYSPVTSV
eukprot:scaffold5856_cov115-Isochrysis_galbana.AAC.4